MRILAALLAGLLCASLVPATASSAEEPPAKPAKPANQANQANRSERAEAALDRVRELLGRGSGQGPSSGRGAAGAASDAPGRELTLALRDLAATKAELDTEERQTAERLLARPDDGLESPYGEPKYGDVPTQKKCWAVACVHWVSEGKHAATDAFAEKVLRAAARSSNVMERKGYRPPLRDANLGGNATPDVYLANLEGGYYGYAATEGYHSQGGKRARFGYMVLDNDYAEFCANSCDQSTAAKIMRATAAHEFFHLVQFGYDFHEARWFMEATASWMEDEIFDHVNDNVNFLYAYPSALQAPHVPLDAPRAVPYGNWIWFRHLSERFGADVVRGAWRRADTFRGYSGNRDPRNLYSLRALRSSVASQGPGGKWNARFAQFAADNQWTRRWYDEGRGQSYPSAPKASKTWLTTDRRLAVGEYDLSRLASATHRIRPGKGLYRNWRLRVTVEGNTGWHGGHALATILRKDGRVQRVHFPLGSNRRKTRTLPFGKSDVRWVDLTTVNASTRYQCWLQVPDTTCHGRSRDNNQPQKVTIRAVR